VAEEQGKEEKIEKPEAPQKTEEISAKSNATGNK